MSRVRPFRFVAMIVVLVTGSRAMIGDEPSRKVDVVSPTVQLRNGNKTGSGTVVRSVLNDTLILTAAHVVKGGNDLKVEIHRHNLNPNTRSAMLTEGGGWPRLVPATIEAIDSAADVAIVRIRGMTPLPRVCRFDSKSPEPAEGNVLTSVGIDRSLHLTRWNTGIVGPTLLEINPGEGQRRFTITTRFPEFGHSGGGLFRADGTVVGVCVGQLSVRPGAPKVGVFASVESVRKVFEAFEAKNSRKPSAP